MNAEEGGRDAPETPRIELGVSSPHRADDRTGARVRVPFSQDFVDALKRAVSHGDRRWNPGREAWWVVEEFAEDAQDLVAEHFGGYQLIRSDGPDVYRDGSGTYEQPDLL